jgi:hypothetical protein
MKDMTSVRTMIEDVPVNAPLRDSNNEALALEKDAEKQGLGNVNSFYGLEMDGMNHPAHLQGS